MKFLAQLQMWEPLVLLQSWEQVPKRRHSLTSGWQGMGVRGGDQEGAPTHTARASPSLHYPGLGEPVSLQSPCLCPKDTIPDTPATPQAGRHILLAKTNRKPNSLTPNPLRQRQEVPWQEFFSGTFWKPLRQVQYVVDRD